MTWYFEDDLEKNYNVTKTMVLDGRPEASYDIYDEDGYRITVEYYKVPNGSTSSTVTIFKGKDAYTGGWGSYSSPSDIDDIKDAVLRSGVYNVEFWKKELENSITMGGSATPFKREDRVRVRKNNTSERGLSFTTPMKKYEGRIGHITQSKGSSRYRITLDDELNTWDERWLEPTTGYNVGDKVTIRRGNETTVFTHYAGSMKRYEGMTAKIISKSQLSYGLDVDSGTWEWADDWLEPYVTGSQKIDAIRRRGLTLKVSTLLVEKGYDKNDIPYLTTSKLRKIGFSDKEIKRIRKAFPPIGTDTFQPGDLVVIRKRAPLTTRGVSWIDEKMDKYDGLTSEVRREKRDGVYKLVIDNDRFAWAQEWLDHIDKSPEPKQPQESEFSEEWYVGKVLKEVLDRWGEDDS